ncbi:hypothetical protein UlMin_008675 [Ulmus minor]
MHHQRSLPSFRSIFPPSLSKAIMSDETTTPESSTTTSDSISKFQSAIQSLSSILPSIPPPSTALSLLHDPDISSHISTLLRDPNSGAGDNNLCRWLYDTFQSNDSDLQLVVLRFIPIISGLYLSRITLRKPLAGFEAILLSLYAHETNSRAAQAVIVNVPDLSHPSLYHESTTPAKNNATALHLAVVSPSLDPAGTVRSTRRATIVGVALELYYSKICQMPEESKIDFCEFCSNWAGNYRDLEDDDEEEDGNSKAIPLPWELFQPILRILGHCLMGPIRKMEVLEAAMGACRSLHARSLHDISPKAILATESLLKLANMALDQNDVLGEDDPTEIRFSNVISYD